AGFEARVDGRRAPKVRALEEAVAEAGAVHARFAQIGLAEVAALEVCVAEVRASELGPEAHIARAQLALALAAPREPLAMGHEAGPKDQMRLPFIRGLVHGPARSALSAQSVADHSTGPREPRASGDSEKLAGGGGRGRIASLHALALGHGASRRA